jgi:hypothetical protein
MAYRIDLTEEELYHLSDEVSMGIMDRDSCLGSETDPDGIERYRERMDVLIAIQGKLTEAAGGAAGADEEDHGDGEAGTRHQGLHADVEVLGELRGARRRRLERT